jgi:hypothetical protein
MLSPFLLAPQLSFCFCPDGYGICVDCRFFKENVNDLTLQSYSLISDEIACECRHKNTEIENVSVSIQKALTPTQNIADENSGASCVCVKIDSLASVNNVLNGKENNQMHKIWLFAHVVSSIVLSFPTPELSNLTIFSINKPTYLLPVRLHLFQSVLLI